MKKHTLLTALALSLFTLSSYAQSLSGYDIMKKADDVPSGNTSSYTATMTLTDKKGKVRTREVFMRSKDYGDTTKSVICFTTPKDVAGVAYLMFEYDDESKDSDNWLYMPAMKKVRRISGSGKSDDFMGTDFTYEDIGERGLAKDTFTLLSEETVAGSKCYKVEAVAKDKTEKNPRRIVWIRADNFMMVKAEFYDRQNRLQRELTCSDIKQVDGYWTTGRMFIRNVQKEHSTTLEMKNVRYDIQIDDSIFTVSALERGAVK